MAVAFETATITTADFGGGSGTINVAKPSGLSSGDVWLIFTTADLATSGGVPTVPSGWVDITGVARGAVDGWPAARAFYKIADGSEGATQAVSMSTDTYSVHAHSIRISGADATNTIGRFGIANSLTSPNLYVTNNGSLVLLTCSYYVNTSSTPTAPAGSTSIQASTTGNFIHSGSAYLTANAGDTVTPGTWTGPSNQDPITFAIEFIPSGGTVPLTYVGKSNFANGTGALTVTLPTVLADDIILLGVETANQPVSAPTGFTQVDTTQAFGTAAAIGALSLQVFWKRATGSETTISVADSGNHTTAIAGVYRGCISSGTPFEGENGSTKSTASTSNTLPGLTTTNDAEVVVLWMAMDVDGASTNRVTAISNANLAALTERHDQTVAAGVGGGLFFADGIMPTAGATGTTSATSASTAAAYLTLALIPEPSGGGGTVYDVDATESLSLAETVTGLMVTAGAASESLSLADSETGSLPGAGVTLTLTRPDTAVTGTGSLSNGDLTWTSGTGYNRAWSTTKKTLGEGKFLVAYQFVTNTTAGDIQIGWGSGDGSAGEGNGSGAFLGGDAGEIGVYFADGAIYQSTNNDGRSAISAFGAGDWVLAAIDLTDTTNGPLVFLKKYSGGVEDTDWNSNGMAFNYGTQDPVNYTGTPHGLSASMLDYYVEVQSGGAGDVFTVDFTGATYPGTTTLTGYEWWDAGGTGGTTYNDDDDESITLAETVTAILVTAGAASESVSLAESQSGLLSMAATASESVTVAETVTSALATSGAASEALSLSDAVAGGLLVLGDLTESLSLAETVTGGLLLSGDLTETLSLADALTGLMSASMSASESLTLADTSSASAVLVGARAEALALADSEVGNVTQSATLSEALALSETATGGLLVLGDLSEALSLSETAAGALALDFSVTETLAFSETVSGSLVMAMSRSETLALADAESQGGGIAAGSVEEALAFADSVSAVLIASASMSETWGLHEIVEGEVPGSTGTQIFGVGGKTVEGRFLPVTVVTVEGTIPRQTDD